MRPLARTLTLAVPAAMVATTSGYATTYLSVNEAQAAMCPGSQLTPVAIELSSAERSAIRSACGIRVRERTLHAWRANAAGWFLVDQVLGKHEFITYAVVIGPPGKVESVEILDYRETYGGEVRDEHWRRQFVGKSSRSPLKLDADIRNISGATLSCRAVTDGIKRLLATYDLVLSRR